MSDDVAWLRSFEAFGGHLFEMFNEHDAARCANIARTVVEREDFVSAFVDIVLAGRAELEDKIKVLIELGQNTSFEEFQLRTWDGRPKFAKFVEQVICVALGALERFDTIPKRSSKEHREYYARIAVISEELATALDKEPRLHDGSLNDEPQYLRDLASHANEIAGDPPLTRPNATHADRTFVAKAVSTWMHGWTGGYRHAASASLVNAVFPLIDPIDAGYMQSLARTLPSDD